MHWAILNNQKNLRKLLLNDFWFRIKRPPRLVGAAFLLFIVSGDNGFAVATIKKAG
jgi:hypothetical protein